MATLSIIQELPIILSAHLLANHLYTFCVYDFDSHMYFM